MPDQSGASRSARRPELDGLRGLAILSVVVAHYVTPFLPVGRPPAEILRSWVAGGVLTAHLAQDLGALLRVATLQAGTGVDLFFVLSGFLIGGILIDNRASTRLIRTFYVRRVARIVPLYAGLLVATTTVALLPHGWGLSHLVTPVRDRWMYATFLQNFSIAMHGWGVPYLNVTWSLAVEEQFYLFLPALILIARPRVLPWLCAGMALSASLLRFGLLCASAGTPDAPYVLTPCRLDALMLGVLCAWAVRQARWHAWLTDHPWLLRGTALVALVILIRMTVWMNDSRDAQMKTVGYSLFAIFYAGMLLLCYLRPSSPEAALTRLTPLRWLGIRAYGIYLLHVAVLSTAFALAGRQQTFSWLTASSAIATLSLAAISWRFIEKPLLAWGHRFRY